MRSLFRTARALALCVTAAFTLVAPASALPVPLLAGAPPPFTAPTVKPTPSTFLGYNTNDLALSVNAAITLPAGAMNVPSTVTNSWFVVEWFHTDDMVMPRFGSGISNFASFLSNCATAACTGGSDRFIRADRPDSGTAGFNPYELGLQLSLSSAKGWFAPTSLTTANRTGIVPNPNSDYCAVLYQPGQDAGSASGLMSFSLLDGTGSVFGQALSNTVNNAASPGTATLYYSVGSGTPRTRLAIGDVFLNVGSTQSGTAAQDKGSAGSFAAVAMVYGKIPTVVGGGTATPDLTTLQSLCGNGHDLKTAIQAIGSTTLNYLATAQSDGTWKADASGTVTTDPTMNGTHQAASPVLAPPCMTLVDNGAGEVFRVEPGQTGSLATGTVYIEGTVSKAACGGKIAGVVAKVKSAGVTVAAVTVKPNAAGYFRAAVPGVLNGGPYTREASLKNSPAYVYPLYNPVYVGFRLAILGQSEMCVFLSPNGENSGTGTGLALASGEVVSTNILGLAADGGIAWRGTNTPQAHPFRRQLDPTSVPGNNANALNMGAGGIRLAKDLIRRTGGAGTGGWPVEIDSYCANGHPSEAWTYGFLPSSAILTNTSGNTYAGGGASNIITAASIFLPDGVTAAPGTATQTVSGAHAIKPSTFTIVDGNGALLASDDGAGNLNDALGASLCTGCLVYEQNAAQSVPSVAVTFAAPPTGPVKAKWTNIEDTIFNSYAPHTSYIGYDLMGDMVTPASGHVTNIASRNSGPPSMALFNQCSSNASSMSGGVIGGATAGMTDQTARWTYTLGTRFPALKSWGSNVPIMVIGYPRVLANPLSQLTVCRQFSINMAALGAPYYWGGSLYDDSAIQGFGHPDTSVYGGQREGLHLAEGVMAVQAGHGALQPLISTAAFDGDHNHILVTMTMPNGGALATCGGTLGAVNGAPPTFGVGCTVTTGNGTPCKGFFVGSGGKPYAEDGWAENISGTGADFGFINSSSADNRFSCTITGTNTVELVKEDTVNVWPSGITLQYVPGNPMFRDTGAASGSVIAYTITNGGTTYTPGTFILSTTGGTCTITPQLVANVSAGGIVTQVWPYKAGLCTVLPTGVSNTGLTKGAGTTAVLTPATLSTRATDDNDLGFLLYDNTDTITDAVCGSNSTCIPGPLLRELIVPITIN